MRNTNRFNVALMKTVESKTNGTQYTFAIQAPEPAAYSWENEPTDQGTVTYVPHYTGPGEASDVIVSARLNTMRLLNREGRNYRFIIKNADTGDEIWSYDLMKLLSIARPTHRACCGRPARTGRNFLSRNTSTGRANGTWCLQLPRNPKEEAREDSCR